MFEEDTDYYKVHSSRIYHFNSLDLLIETAYNYVSTLNLKITPIKASRFLSFGFKTPRGNYFMITLVKSKYGKHELYDQIIRSEFSLEDYINNQLKDLVFYA
jgi:hypothetical protein